MGAVAAQLGAAIDEAKKVVHMAVLLQRQECMSCSYVILNFPLVRSKSCHVVLGAAHFADIQLQH